MNITKEELRELLEYAEEDMRFGVALRGALSQIRHKRYLIAQGHQVKVNPSDNQGLPDFIVDGIRLEHKGARNKGYANGDYRVELQKSRGKGEGRAYDTTFADVIAVDVSERTGKEDDYRYARGGDLQAHKKYPHKWATFHRIDKSGNKTWKASLKEVLNNT